MSDNDDHSQYRRGQIAGLQHICALLINHLIQSPGGRTAFFSILRDFNAQEWVEEDAFFLEGITNSFSEVSLHILRD